jgi:hypothetical protein
LAMPDGHPTGELVIPGREVPRRCANLLVGQLGVGQPVTYLARQQSRMDAPAACPSGVAYPKSG